MTRTKGSSANYNSYENLRKWESKGFSSVPFEPTEEYLRRDPDFVKLRRGLNPEQFEFCKAMAVLDNKNRAMKQVKGDRITDDSIRKKSSEWMEKPTIKAMIDYLDNGVFPNTDPVTEEEALGIFQSKFRQAGSDPDSTASDLTKLWGEIKQLRNIDSAPEKTDSKKSEPVADEEDNLADFISDFREAGSGDATGEPGSGRAGEAKGGPPREVCEGDVGEDPMDGKE